MAGKHKSTSYWKIATFVLLVVISGYVLNVTGHFDNPFSAMSDLNGMSAMNNLLDGQPQGLGDFPADGAPPILSASSGSNTTSSDAPILSASDSANSTAPLLSALPEDDDDSASHDEQDTAMGDNSGAILPARDRLARGPRDGNFNGPGEGSANIQWSEIGDVLFDVWFLFAVTAVIVVLQQIIRLGRSLFKKRLPQTAAA